MASKLKDIGIRVSGFSRNLAWSLFDRNPALLRLAKAITRGNSDRSRRIPKGLGVKGLIAELERRNARYLVLRWFDSLPEVSGDLDILIADDDATIMRSLLTQSPEKGGVQCDVYSVSGLPRYDYHGLPHLPPVQAEGMMMRAIRHETGAWVPEPHDHFLSLAFHAVYHKGPKSGIPLDSENPPAASRRPYSTALDELSSQLGLGIPITMRSLDGYLKDAGWQPSLDMLIKLGVENVWCRLIAERIQRDLPTIPGLSVGIIRSAADDEAVEQIIAEFESWGFLVLGSRRLSDAEVVRALSSVRGGNWGRGSWPEWGGAPAQLIAAIDPHPIPPSAEILAKQPGTDNQRVVELKSHLRRSWNSSRSRRQRANIIHTSDNAQHALHYLQAIFNQEVSDLDTLVDLLAPTVVLPLGSHEAGTDA